MHSTSLIAVATAGRHDLFGLSHKGLRRAHAVMAERLGRADFAVDQAPLLRALRDHLMLVEGHRAAEQALIRAALSGRGAAAAACRDERHREHRGALAMLEMAVRAVEGAAGLASRVANARQLYVSFTRFVAQDLNHMADEEDDTWPRLCDLFADDELVAIGAAVMDACEPGESGRSTQVNERPLWGAI